LRLSVYIAKKAEATVKESSARKEISQALRAWEFHIQKSGLEAVEAVRAGGVLAEGRKFVWLVRGAKAIYRSTGSSSSSIEEVIES